MDRRYDMPEQVLFNILLYLPVMSLLRFKSVCKSWYSTIDNPFFITQHQNCNNDKEGMLAMIHLNEYDGYETVWLSESQYKECFYIDFSQLMWRPIVDVELVSSCNGIICVYGIHSLDVALWNPALKQLRLLPQPLFSSSSAVSHPMCGRTGFGIDGKTNDFKVLKIFEAFTVGGSFKKLGNHVEVYSSRENSWRIIYEDGVLPFTDVVPLTAISSCENGKCFWISVDDDYSQKLLSFDFHDEVFETMPFPDGEYERFTRLSTCNDKIAYIRQVDGRSYLDGGSIEIWMLHEFGVKESWNRIYKIRPLCLDSLDPKCFSKNGEILIFGYKGRLLYLYNLHTQEEIFLQFLADQIIHYSPSLVSVKMVKAHRAT